MAIVLSFVPRTDLLSVRRRVAPHARFDRLSKSWSVNDPSLQGGA